MLLTRLQSFEWDCGQRIVSIDYDWVDPAGTRMSKQPISDVIGELYDAVGDDAAWPVVWASLANRLSASSATLYVENARGPELDFLSLNGWTEPAVSLYAAYYNKVDPFAAYGRDAAGTGAVLGPEICGVDDYRESEIWRDLGRYHVGAFHFLIGHTDLSNNLSAKMAFHRLEDARPFSAGDQRTLMAVLPHLQRALKLRAQIAIARTEGCLTLAALEAIPFGIIVCDANSRVILVNNAARSLVTSAGLILGGAAAGLHARNRRASVRLAALIAQAAADGAGGSLRLDTSDGSVAVMVSRLPASLRPYLHTSYVLVLLKRLTQTPRLDPALARGLYALTQAETEVAVLLVQGFAPDAIAAQRGTSLFTVRAQIRHLLSKTEAESLRDLVQRLTMLAS